MNDRRGLAQRRGWKRALPLVVTTMIMAVVIWRSDWRAVAAALAEIRLGWFGAALVLFVPLICVSGLRWRAMVRPWVRLKAHQAIGHTLAASTLNLILPSKLGDFGRVGFLCKVAKQRRNGQRAATPHSKHNRCGRWVAASYQHAAKQRSGDAIVTTGSAIVLVEKALDLVVLLVLISLGILVRGNFVAGTCAMIAVLTLVTAAWLPSRKAPGKHDAPHDAAQSGEEWECPVGWLKRLCARLATPLRQWRLRTLQFVAWSLGLWCIHLMQVSLLFRACGLAISFSDALWRVPIALLAGLVPWTIAGIGTRDSALLMLFGGMAPAGQIAAVGMLTALRYVVPGVAGMPVLYRCLASSDDLPASDVGTRAGERGREESAVAGSPVASR